MFIKLLVGTFSFIGLAFIAATIYLNVYSDCLRVAKGTALSPNGKYHARYYHETCDSKPAMHTIWVGKHGSNTSKLVFTATSTITTTIQLTWLTGNELHVIYPRSLEPTLDNVALDNVFITYEIYNKNNT